MGGGVNFLSGFHSAYCNTGRGNQVMGGVHSGGVRSILLYKGVGVAGVGGALEIAEMTRFLKYISYSFALKNVKMKIL